ncbi:MAG: TonB-dependent receptor [Novosphingobium sp.]
MKFGPVCRSLSAGVALGALLAFPAHAQDSASGASGDSTIVVTARRVEERLQDVPISITVLNQEQIDNRNISNSVELATYTPSLGVNARFGPEKASFSIRGFSQELSTEPTVGVYFADVVAPRLRSNITSGNGAGVGQLFDLANVQVLKGPQGTLFGRNTTGGAVLLVPKKPSGDLEGYVEGTYGNYDQRRLQAVLNIPLSESFKIRGGVDWNRRDGYLINRSGIGPDRLNDLDYISARLYILGELTPTLENSTIITYTESDTNNTTGKIAFCNRGLDPNSFGARAIVRPFICDQVDREAAQNYGFYDVENSAPLAGLKQRNWQVINTTTWEASDNLTIKNIASYGQSTESYSFNITGDNTPFPFVITYPGPNNGEGDQWTFTEELQLQGRALDGRLVWQLGGYLERSGPISKQEQVTSIFSACTDVYSYKCTPFALALPTGTLTIGSVGVTRNTYFYHDEALYAQATYELTDRLSLTGGLRYTWTGSRSIRTPLRSRPRPRVPSPSAARARPRPRTPVRSLASAASAREVSRRSRAPLPG